MCPSNICPSPLRKHRQSQKKISVIHVGWEFSSRGANCRAQATGGSGLIGAPEASSVSQEGMCKRLNSVHVHAARAVCACIQVHTHALGEWADDLRADHVYHRASDAA